MFNKNSRCFSVAVVLLLMTTEVFAGTATGLPWESPLETLQNSITGPVALAISLIAIVIGGAMLIFGGELGDFARKMIVIVLVVAMIVMATSLLTTLFGATGAVL
ncbi:MAG: TrbC/VirB2 family protein [Sedimenticola sp.]